MKNVFILLVVLALNSIQFKGYCINSSGCILHLDQNYFFHQNLVKLIWRADISEYDFNQNQFRPRLDFNFIGFQGSQGICYMTTCIQNLGHDFIPDITGTQFGSSPTITNFPALGLYFSSLQSTWPDNKHGVKANSDNTVYPKFSRVFENVDNLGYSAKNIYTRMNLIQSNINYPITVKWTISKKATVTNPLDNLSKNLNGNWVPLTGTFVIWNIQVEINGTLYDVADYYLPIEYAEYLLAGDPLSFAQEHFGGAEMLLNTQKTKVRFSEMSAWDGITWFPLNKWKLTWRIDDENGNLDNRFGWKIEECKYLVSVCGHEDDILNAKRDVDTYFDIGGISTPIISALASTTFCEGGSVTLSSNAISGNQWYRDGVAINNSTGTTLNVTTGGVYTAKVTLNGCSSATSNPIAVTVNPIPTTPTITASASTTFCEGGSLTLSSNASNGNQWYKDGVAINNSTGTTLIVTNGGNYSTKVNLNGCTSATSNTIAVTVNPIPTTPTITASASTTFCEGGNVTLSSNASSGNQWYKDGIAISGSTATTFKATTSGAYTAKVTINGCESMPSNGIIVTVNPTPIAPTVTALSSPTFCSGGNVILTSNSPSGNLWYNDMLDILPISSGNFLKVTTSGIYSVRVKINGCESSSSNKINVTVNPIPATPSITAASATTFCVNGSVTLTSNAGSGNQWYKDGVAINGSTGTTYNATAGGSYTVKTTGNNCESLPSNAIIVKVNQIPPKPAITRNGADLSSSETSGNQWFADGVLISGATSQTYRPSSSGQISVQTTLNGCMGPISDNYYFLITGITDPTILEHSINIFPNPVNDKLTVVSKYIHPVNIQFFDMSGKQLITAKKITGTYEIDVRGFVQGSYILLVTDEKKSKTFRKLIVKLR